MSKKILIALLIILSSINVNAQSIMTNAKYAVITDTTSNIDLLNKNADEQMPPASMSKLMTVYMIFDRIKSGVLSLDEGFRVSDRAWKVGGAKTGGSTMFLKPQSKVSIGDLLRGVIIQSGNDACIVLAEGVAGTEEEFVRLMNEKAAELGLKNSHFTNVTGLPDKNHYMSARDLAILASHIINDFPELYTIYQETEFTHNKIRQENRNPLLYIRSLKGVADGLKTGHTEVSGYGLVGSAKINDRRIVMVINGLNSNRARSKEAETLINWGLKEFENRTLYKRGDRVTSLPVWLGDVKEVSATVDKNLVVTLPKMKRKDTKIEVVYESPLKAPIKKGDKIGRIIVTNPVFDKQTQEADLLAGEDILKQGYRGKFKAVLKYFLKQLREKI
ncbi:MAG: D-alanyl-D-alanine carboxypeptidase DacC precursor [Alphaproteobacteria bacterium ADurb.Bin438]|nr:MAG: D-alanyl-D-alanine carboxypeptidase DacC precursor [Alphaproteobacteria bacterium ADurb.Bin438]